MQYIIGFVIALFIALTGVGAGTITVPVLVLFLNVPAPVAVAIGLMFSAAIKLILVPSQILRRNVAWRTLGFMLLGGAPGVLVGSLLLRRLVIRCIAGQPPICPGVQCFFEGRFPVMANFQIMTKPMGPICNLDCTYCYYLEKENLYGEQKNFRMKDELLESYIRQYIQSQSAATVSFAWQGGEPTLLGVPFFERVIQLQAKYCGDKRIENAFQTNGTLLDDQWGEFLARNSFLIGISIDGPAEIHDAYRVDKGGRPTHARVLRGLEVLKRHKVEFNTLTVVNQKTSYQPLEIYRYLKSIGSRFMQFIPIVEEVAAAPDSSGLRLLKPYAPSRTTVSEWSVEPLQYGVFLQTIFDEWVRADVGRTFVNLFDVALESWMGMDQSLCVFAKTCGSALVMEHNGDLYSCDHFVYPDNKLGNILERPLAALAGLPKQVRFGNAKQAALPSYCIECDVRFACNGECPKHRFLKTPSGEPGLNYLCAGYKHFFHYIDPYMQFMANELKHERAPANVMAWARNRQA